jgi:Cu/Zn superoxide dismutase
VYSCSFGTEFGLLLLKQTLLNMERLFKIGVATLVVMVTLSFSETSQAQAQHGGHGHYQHEYNHKKGGPPPWAPAHGYRNKHDKHQHKHNDKKRKHDGDCCHDNYERDRQHGYHEVVKARKRTEAPLPKRTVVIVHTHK